jgi:hypothetical protein
MPRRIDIELTSSRDDGTWTWRAAGAREPKGTVPAALVGGSAKVGDVLKVDAEFFVDGIQITGVVPTKGARPERDLLEIIGSGQADEPLVTTTLARPERPPRRDGPRRDRNERGDRGDRGDRPDRGREGGPREGGPREGGPRDGASRGGPREGASRPRRERPPRPEAPPIPVVERPKAKRLRAGKAHRNALLESLVEEQRPIAEQVVLGGLPAVRQAIEKQNAERTAAGEPAIAAGPLLEMAEKLVPKVRAAEWRDRAEAAQRDLEVLDLRDLRSVVSAADSGPRDEESRELARVLKEGLTSRVDAEHGAWLAELIATVEVGRIVRALRLSSRPPKAGAPLPADLAAKLTEQAGAALTADAAPERWVAVLDALAFAPVRDKVIPASLPKGDLHPDVQATIARLATRIPKIAHIFEVTPDPTAPRPRPERKKRPPKPKQEKPAKAEAVDAAPAGADEPEAVEAPTAEPETTEPVQAPEPEVVEPEAVEPEVVEPEVVEPEAVEPEAVEPEVVESPPEAVEPETAEQATPEPDAVESDAAEPEPEAPSNDPSE